MGMRYVALLRGVNVGGKNKLPMPGLRDLLTSLGYSAVATYIQSGNAVFESRSAPDRDLIAAAILEQFQIATIVVVRTQSALQRAVALNPFGGESESTLHFGFMNDAVPKPVVATFDGSRFAPEQFAVRGNDVYLHLPNGMGTSKLAPWLDRQLKQQMTVRNFNTVSKLLELAEPSA
jgi:uncharacterized protein (DUF1697 family)